MSNADNPTINVDVNVLVDGESTTVVCTPAVALVTDPNSLIIFGLSNPDYQFPTDKAIVIQDGGAEFPNTWYMAPSYVGVRDRRLSTGKYDYTVTVQHVKTGARHSVDPSIENGNE